jgi:hypothetical protein
MNSFAEAAHSHIETAAKLPGCPILNASLAFRVEYHNPANSAGFAIIEPMQQPVPHRALIAARAAAAARAA